MALHVDSSCALAHMSNKQNNKQTTPMKPRLRIQHLKFTEFNKKTRRNDWHKLSSNIQENDIGRFTDGHQEPYVEIVETNFGHWTYTAMAWRCCYL